MILLMGSCELSLNVFKYIDVNKICGLFTAPPKPKNRGKVLSKTCVHEWAEDNNIDVWTPKTLRNEEAKTLLQTINPKIILVASYGFILPQYFIDYVPCVNIHPSKLPRWRGASPIISTILNGDNITALSIMLMDYDMDTGPILFQEDYILDNNITTPLLTSIMANKAGSIIESIIDDILNNAITGIPQQGEATYTKKIAKIDGLLDFNKDAIEIDRMIRAFTPWPGTWTIVNGKILKIIEATINYNGSPYYISCGNSSKIYPTILQLEGKSKTKIDDFIRGNRWILENGLIQKL